MVWNGTLTFVCLAQRHAARDSSVHDPLLGDGDPYGLEADPTSASHAPTPAANIAGMAHILKLCLPICCCCCRYSQYLEALFSSHLHHCLQALQLGKCHRCLFLSRAWLNKAKFLHSITAGRF